jgi:hypothetical protein
MFMVYLQVKPDMLGSGSSLVFITHQTKRFKLGVLTFNCLSSQLQHTMLQQK